MNSEHITVRFDLSHVLTGEPEIDGTYYIDCKVHPAHIPVSGDRVWIDENDMCTVSRDKHIKHQILREIWLQADNPAFLVDHRIMNYCKYIGFSICCVLERL